MKFHDNHTCEIIDFICGGKIDKTPFYIIKGSKILNLYEVTSQDKLSDFMRSPRHIIILEFYQNQQTY